jgi:hypothetical protein
LIESSRFPIAIFKEHDQRRRGSVKRANAFSSSVAISQQLDSRIWAFVPTTLNHHIQREATGPPFRTPDLRMMIGAENLMSVN